MGDSSKATRPKARLPRGFRDRGAGEIAAERKVIETIRGVYEAYGFQPLETPAFEYTDALGKFLPDVDRPNEGVFSLKDDDEQWLSLRYDLTAPLARHVAANFQNLAKPYRRYQVGPVWRNEKPGPGRYREFLQFDADTVGSASPSADAELLMMLSDTLEALGLSRGDYAIKLNGRKLLDTVLEAANIDPSKRGVVLRAIDKLDRLGERGVSELLGKERKDDSGDITKGADLLPNQISQIMSFLHFTTNARSWNEVDIWMQDALRGPFGEKGRAESRQILAIAEIVSGCGYDIDRIRFDATVVRGLDYYTGAVFEAQLTFPVQNEAGETVVFGSVAGGGRYDDLVARFTGQTVPATGVSIGVSRLITALSSRGLSGALAPLVVVTVMDKAEAARSFQMVADLRKAGIRAEAYVGTQKFGDQMKYADKRGAAIAVIEGGDERAKGEVTLKDLALGAELAKSVESRAQWVSEASKAQLSVRREHLVAAVQDILRQR